RFCVQLDSEASKNTSSSANTCQLPRPLIGRSTKNRFRYRIGETPYPMSLSTRFRSAMVNGPTRNAAETATSGRWTCDSLRWGKSANRYPPVSAMWRETRTSISRPVAASCGFGSRESRRTTEGTRTFIVRHGATTSTSVQYCELWAWTVLVINVPQNSTAADRTTESPPHTLFFELVREESWKKRN